MKNFIKNSLICDVIKCILVSGALSLLYSFMCEAVRVGSVSGAFIWLDDHSRTYIVGVCGLIVIMCGMFYAIRRAYIVALSVGIALFVGAFANFYKTMYRGDPLLPLDFVIALDAAKVSGEIQLPLTPAMTIFLVIIFITVSILFATKLRLTAAENKQKIFINVGIGVCCVPILILYLSLTVWNPKLMAPIGVKIIPSDAALCYKNSGFITGYFLYAQDLVPSVPPNYSTQSIFLAAKDLAEPEAITRADIFIIMLESYYHLDNYPKAVIDDITPNYRRLAKEGVSGYYLSDKYSGGTADMEFGALTGFSTSFLPTGSVPYSEYVRARETPSYPKYLKRHGYRSVAIHPYNPTIYKRNIVYPNLGFDEFISQESFDKKDIKGVYVSDKAVMDKIIEVYESERDAGPVFVHAVTMQNHIPHNTNEYEQNYAVRASYDGVPSEIEQALVSTATGLRDEDTAMGYLTDYLKIQNRQAVVLFFGDHQTSIGTHKGTELLDYVSELRALPPEAYALATHKVPYLMWANYETDNQNKNGGLMPPYQLIAQLAGRFQLPRSAYFEYLYKSSETLPGTNLGYIISPTGGLEGTPTAQQRAILQKQQLLQYDALLGERFGEDIY